MMKMLHPSLLALFFGMAALGTGSALAAEGSSAGSAEAATSSDKALSVRFDSDAADPSSDVLASALESELGVPVEVSSAPGNTGLFLEVRGDRLVARYTAETGKVSERSLELPKDSSSRLDTVVLLSGNLVRNEAGTLLDELRARSGLKDGEGLASAGATGVELEKSGHAGSAVGAVGKDDPATPGEVAKPEESDEYEKLPPMPVDLTFFSPISTAPHLEEQAASFSLGIVYTDMGQLQGFSANAIASRNRTGGRGFSAAGLGSRVDGIFGGVAASGLWTEVHGKFRGAAAAGLFTLGSGKLDGLVAGGLGTHVDGAVHGAQVGGLYSGASRELHGVEVGLVNVAGEVEGAQIGLVNIARGPVRGTQIGLVNIGKGFKGAPIGLLNINEDVQTKFVAWASARYVPDGNPQFSANPMAHVGVKYLVDRFYSMVLLGIGGVDDCSTCASGAVLAPGFAVGYHQPITSAFYFEADVLNQWEVHTQAPGVYGGQAALLRVSGGYRVAEAFSVFVGTGPRFDWGSDGSGVYGSPHFFGGVEVF